MRFYDLAEMRRRLAEIDAEREPLVRLIAAAEAYEARPTSTPIGGRITLTKGAPVEPSKTVLQMTEDVALEAIEETGKPIQTRDVIKIMQDRKLPLPNKNVTNVVSARLSNSSRVEGRRGIGWWPTGRPWPHEQPSLYISGDPVGGRHNENGPPEGGPETGEPDRSPDSTLA